MPIELTMPRLSDTMESGTIIKWNVKEGDKVSSGDVVADIETDKATMEMQVFDDGRIASILVPEGKAVEVGKVIAVIAGEDEDPAAVAKGKSQGAAPPAPPAKSAAPKPSAGSAMQAPPDRPAPIKPEASPAAVREEPAEPGERHRISPVAQRMADEHGIDAHRIHGSGPGGRVIKRDVLQAIEAGRETAAAIPPAAKAAGSSRSEPAAGPGGLSVRATPVSPVAGVMLSVGETTLRPGIVPLSNMRMTIAKRLVESKTTIPHYQVTTRLNMDPLLEFRKTLNAQLEPQGVKLSVNDFLIRACALSIHRHPDFNASWAGDALEYHGEVNVGVAISLPAERGGGLVVATIRHADLKGLRQISAEAHQLAERARTRGLSIQEMADSTFTISNLGMFGVEHFTAIINPPNSAILAVGAALQQPVVRDGQLTVGHEMSATLSLDHRVIDGATAAQFLQTLKQHIENPATLLV